MVIKLNILNTDAKCEDIKGIGIRVRQSRHDNKWYWFHIFSNDKKGPMGEGFSSKGKAIDSIGTFKNDLSNDDMPIYICVGE